MRLHRPKVKISRRDFIRLSATLAGGFALAACTSPGINAPTPSAKAVASHATAASDPVRPRRGGSLAVATVAGPPSLDPHWTASQVTADICWQAVEGLFTLDDRMRIVPQLAVSLESTTDGLRHVVGLQRGVEFHNGKEMASDDVAASLLRWARLSPSGQALFARVDSVNVADKYTLSVTMKRPMSAFAAALAPSPQGAAILPRDTVEGTSFRNQVQQIIGTGPYRVVESGHEGQVTLARWDGYRRPATEPGAGAGQKQAYLDEIRFLPVPDEAARRAGILSGQYQFAYGIDVQHFVTLAGDSRVSRFIGAPSRAPTHHLNLESDVTGVRRVRQAILAAVDPEAALKAGWISPELYTVNGAMMTKDNPWYTQAGLDRFNQKNLEAARALLKEANYRDQPVRYLTSAEYPTMYREATTIAEQLNVIGLRVQLVNLDWQSLVTRRTKADQWEVFSTWHDCAADPALVDWNEPNYPGWWANETVDELREELLSTLGQRERLAVVEKTQELMYEHVPVLKLGDVRSYCLASPRLIDVGSVPHTHFWNAYLTS